MSINWISGKKTYFVAAAMALYAALGWGFGQIDANHAMELILQAAGVAGLRHGVTTGR